MSVAPFWSLFTLDFPLTAQIDAVVGERVLRPVPFPAEICYVWLGHMPRTAKIAPVQNRVFGARADIKNSNKVDLSNNISSNTCNNKVDRRNKDCENCRNAISHIFCVAILQNFGQFAQVVSLVSKLPKLPKVTLTNFAIVISAESGTFAT